MIKNWLWHSPLYNFRRGRKKMAFVQWLVNMAAGIFIYHRWVKPFIERVQAESLYRRNTEKTLRRIREEFQMSVDETGV